MSFWHISHHLINIHHLHKLYCIFSVYCNLSIVHCSYQPSPVSISPLIKPCTIGSCEARASSLVPIKLLLLPAPELTQPTSVPGSAEPALALGLCSIFSASAVLSFRRPVCLPYSIPIILADRKRKLYAERHLLLNGQQFAHPISEFSHKSVNKWHKYRCH